LKDVGTLSVKVVGEDSEELVTLLDGAPVEPLEGTGVKEL
jgi:hypothetical protein